MDITPTLIVTSVVNLITFPLLLWLIERFIGKRLDRMDDSRETARIEMADNSKAAQAQREAERTIILAMARTMLLNNYERCMQKGYYSIEEREVYSKLYESYAKDGGNGIIKEIAPRIRALPMKPPKEQEDV